MNELKLKYGCNPNQKEARVFMSNGASLPFKVLNGRPGYINLLDAFNSFQLVKELEKATSLPSSASFKHVSPTSAAIGLKLDEKLKKACFVDDIEGLDDSLLACSYARARGTDRMSSFGDFIALSCECDKTTAMIIKKEVSDGVIAPSYSKEALEILKTKKNGDYCIIEMDKDYECEELERKQVFGITFEQSHNNSVINEDLLKNIVSKNKDLPKDKMRDLLVALITLKYTQSNSVCFAYDGQAIGVGAGQQSRIHCTRLAGTKADTWFLRQSDIVINLPFKKNINRHDKDNIIDSYINHNEEDVTIDGIWGKYFTKKPVYFSKEMQREYLDKIDGVSLASDAFFPFSDNIVRASLSGVKYIVEPGGSKRDKDVIDKCDEYNMVLMFNGLRLFHH